ncbi:MAG TPA: hypothetical protein VGK56_14035 [Anaerolineales bacterium]
MNNLYHWQDERLVELKMREVEQEVEQARLLKAAGLSSLNLLAQTATALRKLLNARTRRLRTLEGRPVEQKSY